MLLKNSFLLPHFFCDVEFKFSWFRNTKQPSEILILEIVMLLEFPNKTNIELMHFGFTLELPNIDLWNISLLDTHLDLLDTDIPSKYFVCLHEVFKMSSRDVFKTSSKHVFTRSTRHVLKTTSRHSSRRLNVISVTISRLPRCFEVVFKTSSRRLARFLQDVLEKIKLLRWRRVEDKWLLGCQLQVHVIIMQ